MGAIDMPQNRTVVIPAAPPEAVAAIVARGEEGWCGHFRCRCARRWTALLVWLPEADFEAYPRSGLPHWHRLRSGLAPSCAGMVLSVLACSARMHGARLDRRAISISSSSYHLVLRFSIW